MFKHQAKVKRSLEKYWVLKTQPYDTDFNIHCFQVPVYNGLNLCMYNSLKPFVSPYMTKFDEMSIPILSDIATGFLGNLS